MHDIHGFAGLTICLSDRGPGGKLCEAIARVYRGRPGSPLVKIQLDHQLQQLQHSKHQTPLTLNTHLKPLQLTSLPTIKMKFSILAIVAFAAAAFGSPLEQATERDCRVRISFTES